MSSDRMFQIEFFVQVAELGSLTKAADRLEMSNAAASRTLLALEERLGARLVERTTRRLWLTEVGQVFYRRCSAMLSEIAEAEAEVNEATLQPTGTLHVTSPVSFAMLHIAPALPEFQRRYPQLKVQITTANRYFDFIEAGMDVAIRTREYESDSNITVRKLARNWRVMAASPGSVLQRGGTVSSRASLLLYRDARAHPQPHEPSSVGRRRGSWRARSRLSHPWLGHRHARGVGRPTAGVELL